MIIGLGTDLVSIERIEKLINADEAKCLQRILSTAEQEIALALKKQNIQKYYNYIAKRYAAKEAFSKAMGVGIGEHMKFKEISTLNNENGMPYISLSGTASKTFATLKKKHKKLQINVSLSDEPPMALASVIISTS
jgi:holo-[acyl-carrier-protein] synthase